MDANKAVELGLPMSCTERRSRRMWRPPAVSMLYSKAAVVNSLMDKIAAKCRTNPKKTENLNPRPLCRQSTGSGSIFEALRRIRL